jgi:hypothetical protein
VDQQVLMDIEVDAISQFALESRQTSGDVSRIYDGTGDPLRARPRIVRRGSPHTDCMRDGKYAVQDRRSNTHVDYPMLYEGHPEQDICGA